MLLENFHKACQGNIAGVGINGASSSNLNITSYPTNGSWYEAASYGRYVDVGFGETAVTKDDYKLDDSNVIDNRYLTWLSTVTTNASPAISSVVTVYRNDGNSDIQVRELGLIMKNMNAASRPANNILLARKVLDTPITVHVGETMAFTYSIELDFGENVNAVSS